MEYIFIGVLLAIVIVTLTLVKLGIVASVKVTALYFDYVVICVLCMYIFHTLLSKIISDSKLIWFLDIVITTLVIIGYYIISIIVNNKLPVVSKITNYIISLIGAIMATRLSIYIFKVIFGMFNDKVVANGDLTFFDSSIANKIIQLTFSFIISFSIYSYRMRDDTDVF